MKYSLLLFPLFLFFSSCKETSITTLDRIEGKEISITDSIPANDSISAFIEPYKQHIDEEMNAVLSYSVSDLKKTDGELNTALGNMMADAVMELSNPIFQKRTGHSIDIVLLNHGGIRSSINQGDVTTRSAYQLMPFENEVIVAEMTGQSLRKMIRFLIDSGTAHPVSGIELVIGEDNSIKKALVQGTPIKDDGIYYVATNDYLFHGGDNMVFFSEALDSTYIDYKIRNILLDYFSRHDTIAPVEDERFIRIK
ncbi:5'-nucleotidase C-terminal domain-containing protein [Salinimicrobium soli]|uniref:5'-nucleotidase C-terminal domain-containing protein n=1 Tax=Salinimicrobium soli TaxID=1254399 RepID=UPI003AACF0CE